MPLTGPSLAVDQNVAMLIYDGDCGFCTKTARWLEAQLATPITVIAWQEIDDLGELGLTIADVSTAAYWVDAYGRTSRGHLAAGRCLVRSRGLFALLGWLILLPPGRWIAAPAYRLIARYRHHLPGATAACAMPTRTSLRPSASAT